MPGAGRGPGLAPLGPSIAGWCNAAGVCTQKRPEISMVVLQIIQRSSLLRFAQVLIVGLLQVAGVPVAQTATVPSGFEDAAFVRGVSRPTAMAFAPDGRLFVCEQ